MVTAIIFIVVGLLMIFFEFFLPGGIMGLAGALFCIVGLILFAVTSPSVALTIGVFVVTIASVVILGRYALKRIRATRDKGTIYLDKDEEGFKASHWSKELVGKRGRVEADLKPAGHVEIEGTRYQAVSRMGYLQKGDAVEVTGGEGAHLIVKKIQE